MLYEQLFFIILKIIHITLLKETKFNVLFARYLYLIMNYLLLDTERSEICICFTTMRVFFFIIFFLPVKLFS